MLVESAVQLRVPCACPARTATPTCKKRACRWSRARRQSPDDCPSDHVTTASHCPMIVNPEGSPSTRHKPARAAGVKWRWWFVLDAIRAAKIPGHGAALKSDRFGIASGKTGLRCRGWHRPQYNIRRNTSQMEQPRILSVFGAGASPAPVVPFLIVNASPATRLSRHPPCNAPLATAHHP